MREPRIIPVGEELAPMQPSERRGRVDARRHVASDGDKRFLKIGFGEVAAGLFVQRRGDLLAQLLRRLLDVALTLLEVVENLDGLFLGRDELLPRVDQRSDGQERRAARSN